LEGGGFGHRLHFAQNFALEAKDVVVSDHELGMKMVEEEELGLFLEAYEITPSDRLQLESWSERPDFICSRQDGGLVGVELRWVMCDRESRFRDSMFGRDPSLYDIVEEVHWAITEKDRKRCAGVWAHRDNTILVLQESQCPLSRLGPWLDDLGPAEFTDHGFAEVWIADHSELDAYGNIELFGLYPESVWGHFEQYRGKPYG
jgi:hypothetical protein